MHGYMTRTLSAANDADRWRIHLSHRGCQVAFYKQQRVTHRLVFPIT